METRPTVRINGRRFAQCATEANAIGWVIRIKKAHREIVTKGFTSDELIGKAIDNLTRPDERFIVVIDYSDWKNKREKGTRS